MAALASSNPIPMPSSHWAGGTADLYRKPSKRALTRKTSGLLGAMKTPPASLQSRPSSRAFEKDGAKVAVGDSSDDEDLAPIKLSAEARELLGEEASQISASPRDRNSNDGLASRSLESRRSEDLRQGSKFGKEERVNGSPPSRARQQSSGARPQPMALGRDGSFFYRKPGDHGTGDGGILAVTPAPQLRTVRINGSRSQTRSPPSSSPVTQTQDGGSEMEPDPIQQAQNRSGGERSSAVAEDEAVLRGLTTAQRSRRGDERSMHSTLRVKRTGKMTGAFLSGPLRRGMIRRQSEDEDVHPSNSNPFSRGSPGKRENSDHHKNGNLQRSPSSPSPILRPALNQRPREADDQENSPQQHHVSFSTSATVVPSKNDGEAQQPQQQQQQQNPHPTEPSTQVRPVAPAHQRSVSPSRLSSARVQSMFKVPPPPDLPSAHDQENEPPPTFKKSKPAPSVLGEVHKIAVLGDRNPNHATPATHSPQRKPLAPRSQNTPHRAAPQPPPKMSVLEAATSTAGSARSRKKIVWSVNGKLFTRLDCIGRGGSSRVYRVMAENYKMFALKRVNLEEADAASIVGYRGEIDLLRRLENVERVVRLFDYEINEDKGELKVLMEMGETDFNRMLNLQLKSENARFDVSFTRYYWREMLECVQAVHECGIVHSDLKPANFLVVQGRLKIIDFGIANAIQDNTVNVHRENQIGTPNYMSPEALVDCNALNVYGKGGAAAAAAGGPAAKGQQQQLLKLGRPSDVWSLGCILYQMVYGLPPFGHIPNAHQRIMSIPNARVPISFAPVTPTTLGAVPVPLSLINTLKGCLDRDQHRRPTIPELLAADDPFLNPHDSSSTSSSSSSSSSSAAAAAAAAAARQQNPHQVLIDQPMLAQVLQKVVHYCRSNPGHLPQDATLNEWAATFLDRIGRLDEAGGGKGSAGGGSKASNAGGGGGG